MNANTEPTMSPADVLATLDELNSAMEGEFRGANERDLTGTGLLERGPRARTAVAALIEREAALESKLEGARIACANLTASLSRAEAERAALAERVKALEALHAAVIKNGEWNDGCFYYEGRWASELQHALSGIDDFGAEASNV